MLKTITDAANAAYKYIEPLVTQYLVPALLFGFGYLVHWWQSSTVRDDNATLRNNNAELLRDLADLRRGQQIPNDARAAIRDELQGMHDIVRDSTAAINGRLDNIAATQNNQGATLTHLHQTTADQTTTLNHVHQLAQDLNAAVIAPADEMTNDSDNDDNRAHVQGRRF